MSYAQDTGKFDSSLQATKPETIKNWVPRRKKLLGNKFLGGRSKEHKPFFAHVQFNIEDYDMFIFERAFIEVVENAGMRYNTQEVFHTEGYFRFKVTPLGENLCFLEEIKEGEIKALISKAKYWIGQ